MRSATVILTALVVLTATLPAVLAIDPPSLDDVKVMLRPPTHEECNYGDYPYVECCTVDDDTGRRYSCQWCDYETTPPECWEGY
jgi:hypothetical protein